MKKLIVTVLCAFSLLIVQPVAAQQDEALFRNYIISSGFHGLFYGIALIYVTDIQDPSAVGLPVLTAGASVLIPLLTNPRITTNSLILSNHGRTMGWFHGFALSALILGDEMDSEDMENIVVVYGAVSSIGLGVVGSMLDRNRPWEEGQAALLAHYCHRTFFKTIADPQWHICFCPVTQSRPFGKIKRAIFSLTITITNSYQQ